MLLMMFCCFYCFCFVVQICLFKFVSSHVFIIQQNMLRNMLKTSDLKPQNILSKHFLFYVVSFSSFLFTSSFFFIFTNLPKTCYIF
ncbi:unnamed protein product [Meloidogyne enterolobii]|uniref:Uncharacterized protein n=1 Tax=Meloidogyne enterolobii TaxID=390850 RepID=A0ACB0Z928_MELEN